MSNFTPEQLEEQRKIMHEDIFNFITQAMNMYSIGWAGWTMEKMNMYIQARRRYITRERQKALDTQQKEILLKKRDILNELEKYDKVANQLVQYPTSFSSKEIAVTDVAKKRRVGTMLAKPTNIMLDVLKAETKPSNVGNVHKR